MKVLLFVQSGDERPKCVARWVRPGPTVYLGGQPSSAVVRGRAAKASADRWWLVECKNADEGRRLIEADDGERFAMGTRYGRILASGGRESAGGTR